MRPVLVACLAASLLAAGCAAGQAEASAAPGGADYISCAWPQPPAHQAMARHGRAGSEAAPQEAQADPAPAK